jgi:succinate-acetate transporter protein
VITAATAWYASAAGVINNMAPRPVLPVGKPVLFGQGAHS